MSAPNLGTENPMTDQEILVERVARAIDAEVYGSSFGTDASVRLICRRTASAAIEAIASMPHSEQVENWQPMSPSLEGRTCLAVFSEPLRVGQFASPVMGVVRNGSFFNSLGEWPDMELFLPYALPDVLTRNVSDKE